MAQVLVRNLDAAVVRRLKTRARRDGRSLQAEVKTNALLRYHNLACGRELCDRKPEQRMKTILEQAARETEPDRAAALKLIGALRRRFRGRRFPDSTKLIREDRDR